MSQPHPSVFRSEAVQRYQQSQQQAVLPQLVAPRTFLALWVLLALLLAGLMVAWFGQTPVYAVGSGVVIQATAPSDGLTLVGLLPPENLARLHVGQRIILQSERGDEPITGEIIAVEAAVMSPAAIQQRYATHLSLVLPITQPAAVVTARVERGDPALPEATYVGSVYRMRVEIGAQRILSLLSS